MKPLSLEQQRHLVRLGDTAGPELERIRREELRGLPYKWEDVDALLEMGDNYDGPPRMTSGLVEMQRIFMKAARKQGLLPTVVRESGGTYGKASESTRPDGSPPAERSLYMNGEPAILDRPKIALFCSAKCPGKLILDTYDLAKKFRERGVTVISGFHSPMEEECLRNRLVADLADAVVVAHAAPGSKMEVFYRELLAAGKPVYTFDHPANASLLTAGAINVDRLP